MPVYNYICKKCKTTHDITRSMNDKSDVDCPKCKGKMVKNFSAMSVGLSGLPTPRHYK